MVRIGSRNENWLHKAQQLRNWSWAHPWQKKIKFGTKSGKITWGLALGAGGSPEKRKSNQVGRKIIYTVARHPCHVTVGKGAKTIRWECAQSLGRLGQTRLGGGVVSGWSRDREVSYLGFTAEVGHK